MRLFFICPGEYKDMQFLLKIKKEFYQKITPSLLLVLILLSTLLILSCKKEEKDNNGGLLLLFLLNRNSTTESTGFFITIPDGVAK